MDETSFSYSGGDGPMDFIKSHMMITAVVIVLIVVLIWYVYYYKDEGFNYGLYEPKYEALHNAPLYTDVIGRSEGFKNASLYTDVIGRPEGFSNASLYTDVLGRPEGFQGSLYTDITGRPEGFNQGLYTDVTGRTEGYHPSLNSYLQSNLEGYNTGLYTDISGKPERYSNSPSRRLHEMDIGKQAHEAMTTGVIPDVTGDSHDYYGQRTFAVLDQLDQRPRMGYDSVFKSL